MGGGLTAKGQGQIRPRASRRSRAPRRRSARCSAESAWCPGAVPELCRNDQAPLAAHPHPATPSFRPGRRSGRLPRWNASGLGGSRKSNINCVFDTQPMNAMRTMRPFTAGTPVPTLMSMYFRPERQHHRRLRRLGNRRNLVLRLGTAARDQQETSALDCSTHALSPAHSLSPSRSGHRRKSPTPGCAGRYRGASLHRAFIAHAALAFYNIILHRDHVPSVPFTAASP